MLNASVDLGSGPIDARALSCESPLDNRTAGAGRLGCNTNQSNKNGTGVPMPKHGRRFHFVGQVSSTRRADKTAGRSKADQAFFFFLPPFLATFFLAGLAAAFEVVP